MKGLDGDSLYIEHIQVSIYTRIEILYPTIILKFNFLSILRQTLRQRFVGGRTAHMAVSIRTCRRHATCNWFSLSFLKLRDYYRRGRRPLPRRRKNRRRKWRRSSRQCESEQLKVTRCYLYLAPWIDSSQILILFDNWSLHRGENK